MVSLKTGILGGTFDPIHTGHLILAEEVKKRLGLDEIIFIPTGQPYYKADKAISPAADRLNMVKLAISGKPYFRVMDIEIKRSGPTYTADTLNDLKLILPEKTELYFILGWDNLEALPRWHKASEIIRLCQLVAVPRIGQAKPDVDELDDKLPGLQQSLIMLSKPEVDVSSSLVRERLENGQGVEHLVPEAVAAYIKEHGLYHRQ
ncbi:nicotinic acid mononucleotide adenylyltransferase [Dehalococcoides mccartyi]|uniref:nicotinate-nucleotide adenylyltransferase n=1 Tax=Dehalococcoides mccartyi TaxID=61435 RepID=UPI00098FB035|nr:nicotinate-nucleotide adenylyltransferase [Dehalococcoides mccartyi]AQU02488.1 nicotinic acid mononucleotide adenylyltransferase [Dehalococcoides mccartyi]AQU03851.1 nicotinic acid mononucleotide adenylyltransferase [Dehalococcoides mccartyi]